MPQWVKYKKIDWGLDDKMLKRFLKIILIDYRINCECKIYGAGSIGNHFTHASLRMG